MNWFTSLTDGGQIYVNFQTIYIIFGLVHLYYMRKMCNKL